MNDQGYAMPIENVAATSGLEMLEDNGAPPGAAPELDDDGQRAAGWLTEALTAPDAAAPVDGARVRPTGTGLATMGDAILRGMHTVGQHYQHTVDEMHASLEQNSDTQIGIKGMLEMQLNLVQVSLETGLVTKCVKEVPQQVDQLTKLQ
jgi:hypothetical protein